MAMPGLNSTQMGAAREASAQARRVRAELKEQIKTGQLSFGEALRKAVDDETLARIKVVDLLQAVPRVGIRRATKIAESLQIAPSRRIRGLGKRQIDRLAEVFN